MNIEKTEYNLRNEGHSHIEPNTEWKLKILYALVIIIIRVWN